MRSSRQFFRTIKFVSSENTAKIICSVWSAACLVIFYLAWLIKFINRISPARLNKKFIKSSNKCWFQQSWIPAVVRPFLKKPILDSTNCLLNNYRPNLWVGDQAGGSISRPQVPSWNGLSKPLSIWLQDRNSLGTLVSIILFSYCFSLFILYFNMWLCLIPCFE